ncbi:MAG: VanZ family protein [Rubrivivax sp.]|nr:VanZ family protein [Rubrivivax sp.]
MAWSVLLAVLSVYVLYGALTPNPKGPSLGWDKANHAAAFAVLAFCAVFALRERPRHVFWIAYLLLALGLAIEIAQTFVPGRLGDWQDLLADAVGIAVGLMAAIRLAVRLDRRRHPRGAQVADTEWPAPPRRL